MTANTLVICLHLLFKQDLCTCSDILTVTLIEMWNVFWNVWKECVMTGWSWFWMASDGGGGADDIWFAWHCPVPSSILHQSSVTIQPRKKVQHIWIMSELESLTQKEGNKTSRKWLTVEIFWKWQDSSVTLWIYIAVILNWRYGMVWYGGGGRWLVSSYMKGFQSWTIMDFHGL